MKSRCKFVRLLCRLTISFRKDVKLTKVEPILLATENISKAFGGTQALRNVSFDLRQGEIHALLGENGAGKSTLIKILAGDYIPDEGTIYSYGKRVELKTPTDSRRLGIRVIYQEFNLLPFLSVAENINLGAYPRGSLPGSVDWKAMRQRATKVLEQLGEDISPTTMLLKLSVAQQQIVEIAKALLSEPKVLIMDEPTSALNDHETERLFLLLEALKERGVSIIYISHRLEELFRLADRVTVLRDGQTVKTVKRNEMERRQLVQMMVGRDVKEMYPRTATRISDVVLEVDKLCLDSYVHDVSFQIRRGEIVAIYGLVGAGQTNLAEALFGAQPIVSGTVRLDNQQVRFIRTSDARAAGIGLVPDDRKGAGLVMRMGVRENLTLSALPRFTKHGVVDRKEERAATNKWVERLSIRCAGLGQKVQFLSGGNQQKVVIARWLLNELKVLILNQPTRGVDVGAKVEIYRTLEELCKQGLGILMISLELPEVMGLADTVYVMADGTFTGGPFYRTDGYLKEELMRCAVNCDD